MSLSRSLSAKRLSFTTLALYLMTEKWLFLAAHPDTEDKFLLSMIAVWKALEPYPSILNLEHAIYVLEKKLHIYVLPTEILKIATG